MTAWLLVAGLGVAGAPVGDAETGPVVVELFTSQGCSSCPPADRILSRLGEEGEVAGARVIPLAFHVDYWNRIGWEDPFSSTDWSDRQRRYARALELDTIYTPQSVIDGRFELVGSLEGELRRRIEARAVARPDARIDLESLLRNGALVTVEARVRTATAIEAGPLELMVALFESGFETAVRSGENARRTLCNDHVVRWLESVAELEPGPGTDQLHRAEVPLDPGWNHARLGVVAFLQDPETMRIYGADAAPVE